jgi:hypothetical protein
MNVEDKVMPLYIGLSRDVEYFIEGIPALNDEEKKLLWLMLTTPNPEHDPLTEALNSMGADILRPHMKEIPEPVKPELFGRGIQIVLLPSGMYGITVFENAHGRKIQ